MKAFKPDGQDFAFQNLRSQSEVNALKAELSKPAYSALNAIERAKAINDRPQIASGPAPQIPNPAKFQVNFLLGAIETVAPGSISNSTIETAQILDCRDLIKSGDIEGVRTYLELWEMRSHLTSDQKMILLEIVNETVDDPSHPATVPGDSVFSVLFSRTGGVTWEECEKAIELGN